VEKYLFSTLGYWNLPNPGKKISHARFEKKLNTIFDFWTLKLLKSGGKLSHTQFGDVKHT
tara:strand:+ start:759 stop:938 length:180 start_codon:yes stop_codon:yes gene_type:complete